MSRLFDRNEPGNLRETARIVWPLALAMMAGALNHICDRFFLAHHSDVALEAILPAEMLAATLTQFLAATIGYSATFVAQLHGGNQPRAAVRSFAQGLWLALFAVPLFALFIPVGDLVIGLSGHAEALARAESTYFRIAAPGGMALVLNCVLAGILTGQGRTRYAGFCTVAGSLANLLFDPLLIFTLNLGIAGAAIATILSQLVTTALLVPAVVRDPLVRSGWSAGDFAFNPPRCLAILRFGLPLGVNALVSVATFAAFNLMAGRCAPAAFAASNTVFAINNVFFLAACATAQGVTILTGRSAGARNVPAAIRAYRSGLVLAGLALVTSYAVILPCARPLLGVFYATGEAAFPIEEFVRYGTNLLLIMFVREIGEGLTTITAGALRGIGDTKFVMIIQSSCDLFVRTPLVFLVAAVSDSIYLLWLTMPVDFACAAVFFLRRWRKIRVTPSVATYRPQESPGPRPERRGSQGSRIQTRNRDLSSHVLPALA